MATGGQVSEGSVGWARLLLSAAPSIRPCWTGKLGQKRLFEYSHMGPLADGGVLVKRGLWAQLLAHFLWFVLGQMETASCVFQIFPGSLYAPGSLASGISGSSWAFPFPSIGAHQVLSQFLCNTKIAWELSHSQSSVLEPLPWQTQEHCKALYVSRGSGIYIVLAFWLGLLFRTITMDGYILGN